MTVKMGDETDAFEDVIPVEVLVSPETVAAYRRGDRRERDRGGDADDSRRASCPGFGGLHVELASTAMVGLGEGARYLVEYPYGCAEQRGSRALALLLAADLGDAFTLPGMDTGEDAAVGAADAARSSRRSSATTAASRTGRATAVRVSPYLTAYLLHVFKIAADLKYNVDAGDARARLRLPRERARRRSRRRTKAGGRPTPPGRRSR